MKKKSLLISASICLYEENWNCILDFSFCLNDCVLSLYIFTCCLYGLCLWYDRVCIISYSLHFLVVAFCKQGHKYHRQFSLIKAFSSSPNSNITYRFNFYYIMIYVIHLDDNEKVIAFINVAFETEQFNYMESPSVTFA